MESREKTGSRTFVEEKLSSIENGLNGPASKKKVRIPWAHIWVAERMGMLLAATQGGKEYGESRREGTNSCSRKTPRRKF